LKIHIKTQIAQDALRSVDEDVQVVFRKYGNGRIGITLVDMDGVPFATGTVNVPEVDLAPDEVIIKDYSENAGIEAALEAAGLIEITERMVQAGFEICSVSKLTPTAFDEIERQGVKL